MQRLSPCVVVLSVVLAAPTLVSAQGFQLDGYRAAETSVDGFALSRPNDLGHLTLGAQFQMDYALSPLVILPNPMMPGAVERTLLVEHLLAARVGAFIGLIDRFVFNVSLPFMFVMEGEPVTGIENADGGGLGDVQLGMRVRLVGENDDIGSVALQLAGTFPTAEAARSDQTFTGQGGATFSPEAVGELRFEPVRLTGNFGFRFREDTPFGPLRYNHELTWGAGASVNFLHELLEVRVESYGSVELVEQSFGGRATPVELILGLRVQPIDGLVVGLAGGFGIGTSVGAPAFRGALTLGFAAPLEVSESAPDEQERPVYVGTRIGPNGETIRIMADGTEVVEAAPAGCVGEGCTEAPDVTNGGPTETTQAANTGTSAASAEVARPDYQVIDRDGDRVVDARDQCPIDFEDYDEIQDDDGCPEADADQDTYADADDRCPLTPGPRGRRGECAGCPELACVSRASGQIEITERVEFETNEAVLLDSSLPVLNDVLAILSSNDQILVIRIEGHTDDRGEPPDNIDLSRRRAGAVVQWMIEHGIDRARLAGWGCGEAHELAPGSNRTRRGRQANRRVEFLIVDPPSGRTMREHCQAAE